MNTVRIGTIIGLLSALPTSAPLQVPAEAGHPTAYE
jgi:hypothetical protein